MTIFGNTIGFLTFILVFCCPYLSPSAANSTEWNKTKARLERALGAPPSRIKTVGPEAICEKWANFGKADPNASATTTKEYLRRVTDQLSRLYKDQDHFAGALNISEMFRRFERVSVFTDFDSAIPTQATFERTTDFYIPTCRTVVLNRPFLFSSASEQDDILIHVFFGAAGYADENYQLTLALKRAEKLLRSGSEPQEVSRIFPATESEIFHRPFAGESVPRINTGENKILIASGGGYTGAGGGGDASSVLVKTLLFNYTERQIAYFFKQHPGLPCEAVWSQHSNYLADILKLKLESNMTEDFQFSRRRQLGSYWIRVLPSVTSGENSFANLTAIDIFGDYCRSLYGAK